MQVSLIMIVLLLISGCLVQGDRSRAKIDFDAASESPRHRG